MKCQAGRITSWDKAGGTSDMHLRYVDDTTIMAKKEEELKSLLMQVKEESEKAG